MSGFAPLLRFTALGAAPALLLASTNDPAMAQAYSNADRVASTLLAGGMSRLAAISAQQGGGVASSWSPAPDAADAIINDRRFADFLGKLPGWRLQGVPLVLEQPASYRQPDLLPAFMRGLTPAAASPVEQSAAFVMPARPRTIAPLPRSGQPDIFGSVAMAVSRTSLDGKWSSISQPISGKGPWSGVISAARSASRQQQVEMINSWVNRRLRFVDDRQGGDSWASANQSLQRGAGDCEDYAIAKMKLLEAAGFDRHAMFLVIARDLVRQADHALLAVRIDSDLMVLDNMTDAVLPSSSVSDYRPIMSFNAFGRWTHGYKVTPQPVQFAAR